jgi:hypothetical protein
MGKKKKRRHLTYTTGRLKTINKRSVYTTWPNAGISVCASQKLNTSLGPVISSLGVSPLKKLARPSFRAMLLKMRTPDSGFSKLRFWIRVLITSSGADTISDALAPHTDATKFCAQLAEL